jgi:caffeoyl-CoA O-methyltransferase
MSDPKSFFLSPAIHRYLIEHGNPPDSVQQALIDETAALGGISGMQIAPEQGAFMTLLTKLVGAKRAIEVGTFTGYSALCIARGLPADGKLICCDVSEEWTSVGRKYWEQAGVADRIDLRIAPAVETLRSLPRDESVDLAFVDADKPNYAAYYEELLPRLAPNGVMLIDNVLWGGNVIDEDANDANRVAIRAFNDMVAADDRVEKVMLPLGDGLTLIRKA